MEGKSQRNSKGPVPTPTNKGPEEIQEWNRLLELPVEIGTMIFEKRTRELLISEEKSFLEACCNLVKNLYYSAKSAYEIDQQYADRLLTDVQIFYQRVELAREYCLDALDEQVRLEDKYTNYMEVIFKNLCTCERVHRMYLEEQEDSRILRQQPIHSQSSQTQIQPQTNEHNDKCIFCQKKRHRYQLHCQQLRKMTPNQIYRVMTSSGINCQMCLNLGHKTKNCPATKEGLRKKCHIKEDGKECQKYHCMYLHKFKKNNQGNIPEVK